MDIFLNGVKNFLQMINDNWTTILVIAGLVVAIVKKIKDWMKKSEEEKIAIAKEQIKTTILKMVSDAEKNWGQYSYAGSIKRSEVIKRIYEEYPILNKVVDSSVLIEEVDKMIDEALITLREVIAKNEEK